MDHMPSQMSPRLNLDQYAIPWVDPFIGFSKWKCDLTSLCMKWLFLHLLFYSGPMSYKACFVLEVEGQPFSDKTGQNKNLKRMIIFQTFCWFIFNLDSSCIDDRHWDSTVKNAVKCCSWPYGYPWPLVPLAMPACNFGAWYQRYFY